MSKIKVQLQPYPRIEAENHPLHGYLNEEVLLPHHQKISLSQLKAIIRESLLYAAAKSSRVLFQIPDSVSAEEVDSIYTKAGKDLFGYFRKYCGDPASTAYACFQRHYHQVAREHFRLRTLQKEQMNSGWRYQYIAKSGAIASHRFESVSDIGTAEADFNVEISTRIEKPKKVTVYISVKNRINTMGGQDWPKAIKAIEEMAQSDKNRNSPYLCVFGIAMERGKRKIKCNQRTTRPYSYNTEVWPSDFFWPFFINYSYEELIQAVLDVLMEIEERDEMDFEIPLKILEVFGQECRKNNLLDDEGCFYNPHLLASFFTNAKK